MKIIVTFLASLPLLILIPAHAETRYVSDTLYVQVRTGPGNQFRIFKTLKTGSGVEIQEDDIESGYSKVILDGGAEGWMRTQYLMQEPSARIQLSRLSAELEILKTNTNPSQKIITLLKKEKKQLQKELTSLNTNYEKNRIELQHIKDVSGNAIALDTKNIKLRTDIKALQNQLDIINNENTRLQDSSDNESFMNGALAVLLGVIIALVAPHLAPKKRNASSEWS